MNLTAPQRQLQYFFFGQHFSDGLRTTVAVLAPALAGAWLGYVGPGLVASAGALCLSFADLPGPARHRRNGLLAAALLIGLVALAAGGAVRLPWALGLVIGGLSFGLTMLLVWGARAGAVGTAALLSAVLLLARPPAPAEVLAHAALLVAGAAWYGVLALLLHRLQPYRAAQQALGQSLHALAGFLRLKAEFYDLATDLPDDLRRLVAQQARVSEAQEAGRNLLFRTEQIVSETTPQGRRLVLAFVEGVDLYEHVSASSFDYAHLRATFGATGVLAEIQACLLALADDVDALGAAILADRPPAGPGPGGGGALATRPAALAAVQAAVAALEADPAWTGRTRSLRKIFLNLRDIERRAGRLRRYFDAAPARPGAAPATALAAADHAHFVETTALHWAALPQNLTLRSAIFRHALRMLLACTLAHALAETVWSGTHGYWILLTVAVLLKPGFSLTKARNKARLGGTLGGAALGAGLLALVSLPPVRFGIMVVFMLLAYTFQRARYGVSVVFLTAYLLILFSFLGLNYVELVEERVLDTLVGSVIAFGASYFLFPRWESDQLRPALAAALAANGAYLALLAERLAGRPATALAYRLRRKAVYVAAANLQAAFERMLAEPRRKQQHPQATHEFVVLNHVLSAQIAAVGHGLPPLPGGAEGGGLGAAAAPPVAPVASALSMAPLAPEARRALRSAQAALARAMLALAPETAPSEAAAAPPEAAVASPEAAIAPPETAVSSPAGAGVSVAPAVALAVAAAPVASAAPAAPVALAATAAPVAPADPALAEQLAYLQKTAANLARVSEVLAG